MPGLVRKSIIFATVNGLVIQPHAPWDQPAALLIDYKTHNLSPRSAAASEEYKKSPHFDSLGIIGLLKIASFSFLISITKREQVAQIFGKPVYVVTDVALLPLSSQHEADKAIAQVNAASHNTDASADSDTDSSVDETDDDTSHEESPDEQISVTPSEVPTPSADSRPETRRNGSSTSIVEDVIAKRGQYGRFASQWFSRQGWGLERKRELGLSAESRTELAQEPKNALQAAQADLNDTKANVEEVASDPPSTQERDVHSASPDDTTLALLPKVIRSTKMIISSRSFYFSYEFNLTRRLGDPGFYYLKPLTRENFDPLYFWNRHLGSPFSAAGYHAFLIPIMQGFVGQRPFVVKRSQKHHSHTKPFESLDDILNADGVQLHSDHSANGATCPQPFLVTLISRRSTKRSGLRYLRRGIDDEGNCANMVETEQILSSPTWDQLAKIRSFVQVRGSIPLYFSQSPFSFKPAPVLHQHTSVNQAAFNRHFEGLRRRYGSVQIADLVDKHGVEAKIGQEYEEATKRSNESSGVHELGFEWFDFHAECRGMKFENVDRLVKKLEGTLMLFGETVIEDKMTKQQQTGIIRTNCMDCLDRTNVAQCAFGQLMLQKDLEHEGFEIDFLHDESTQWFNVLWADNGDAISRQYASTAALKGDFTRTRKRNYRGALNDLGLTLSRYYNNIVNDYFSQAVIDVLLGNVSTNVFEDFEATMMSADPGISIQKVRETAIETCSKIVIQDPEEDLIHGWTMLSPALPNTLRALPFEESVLLLTDAALYCCKFDWNTEKVASFEKIDLRCVTKLHYGTYITSTLTDRQTDENLNIGIVISHTPGKESVMRVNTRSLQNSVNPEEPKSGRENDDSSHGSIIMAWLGSRPPTPSRIMAIKVIPTESTSTAANIDNSAITTAERICEEIQRAIRGGIGHSEDKGLDMVEKTDIISLAEAHKRTGYLEQLGHSIKKLVWA